jgi:transposase
MGFVQGIHRDQMVMFPESLDEYIGDENPVRFLAAFVDNLDLRVLGFEHAVPKKTGRPPYDPGDLLKLYVYDSPEKRVVFWSAESESGMMNRQ